MKNVRTFLAVDISSNQHKLVSKLIDQFAETSDNFKWTRPDNLHITLNFLGELPEVELNSVCKVAERALADAPSFDLTLHGVGAFPEVSRPRVVWAGIQTGAEEMKAIQKRLSDGLEELGFPPERRQYRPHLTLGRIKRSGRADHERLIDFVNENAELDLGATNVDSVVVYSSFMDRSGPIYTPVSTIDLD